MPIGVFLLVGNIFKRMHYYESLQYLSFIMSALLFLFTGLYLIPQRHISKYPDDDLKSASSSGNYLILLDSIYHIKMIFLYSAGKILLDFCD